MTPHPVFILSDRSGLTAETICHTLLSQFPSVEFNQEALPFVDNREKLEAAIVRINTVAAESGKRPLVFTTFAKEDHQGLAATANAEIFGLFEPFITRMEATLKQTASHLAGKSHGIADAVQYGRRINAVNYALHCDDGLHRKDYRRATVILIGVSRCGKTPTSLYLALHFGFYAANYPLTAEDFSRPALPEEILAHRDKVFGLTIAPLRLHQIRSERRPNSQYASLDQCREEVRMAQSLFDRYRILHCDSTAYSVEELGSTIKHPDGFVINSACNQPGLVINLLLKLAGAGYSRLQNAGMTEWGETSRLMCLCNSLRNSRRDSRRNSRRNSR